MFEPKTHDSFVLCAFAVVMLVMSGLGLTVLIDSQVEPDELEQNVLNQSQKITELEQVVRSLKAKQASADFEEQDVKDKISALEAEKRVLLASVAKLKSAERDAAAEVEEVEKEFEGYREKTRKWIWARAVGYHIGSLTIEFDRTYEGVRIAEISEHGVKIVHDGGTSFIASNNMPVSLREKLQLVMAPVSPPENTPAP